MMERRGGIWRRAPFLWSWCKTDLITKYTFFDPPRNGGELDLNSSNRGCARLGGEVAPPLGVVIEEVAVLIVLVRRHRRAVGSAVRRAVGDEVPGAIEEETGPAAVRRVPPGLFDALPVHALISLSVPSVIPFSRRNLNAAPRSLFYWALAQMMLSEVVKSPPRGSLCFSTW